MIFFLFQDWNLWIVPVIFKYVMYLLAWFFVLNPFRTELSFWMSPITQGCRHGYVETVFKEQKRWTHCEGRNLNKEDLRISLLLGNTHIFLCPTGSWKLISRACTTPLEQKEIACKNKVTLLQVSVTLRWRYGQMSVLLFCTEVYRKWPRVMKLFGLEQSKVLSSCYCILYTCMFCFVTCIFL